VAVAPAEAVAQAAEEAQAVAEGTGGGGAHTARAPQQLVSPVTCAPVGGQHAAHCMAARPPPPRGAVGVRGGVVPRPSTSSAAATGTCAALRRCSAGTGKGRAHRRDFAQTVQQARVALVQLPLLLQRDRLTLKSAPIVARHVVQLLNSDLRTRARISCHFCSSFATDINCAHIFQ
jgi:hypothetical protein